MSKLVLSFHPFFQGLAIMLAFYGAILGFQRTRILHFDQQDIIFKRKHHAQVGFIALTLLLGGMAGGKIIASIVWQGMVVIRMHGGLALAILPFLLFGMGTGLYLYFSPAKRKVLPAFHGVNNAILLILLFYQAYSGIQVYLKYVLKFR